MPSRSKPGSSEPSSSQTARAKMNCLAGAVTTPQATQSGGSFIRPRKTGWETAELRHSGGLERKIARNPGRKPLAN